jgi:hypothetical protein
MSTDWDRYQACPVCAAELGQPCAKTRWVVAGLAEVFEEADAPHTGRKLRAAAREVDR